MIKGLVSVWVCRFVDSGFYWTRQGGFYTPLFIRRLSIEPKGSRMQSLEVDYEIFGNDMQVVEIELDPGEVVVAEAGAMNYMRDGIVFETKMGDRSAATEGMFGKLLGPESAC